MVYGDFSVFLRFWATKNKPNSKPITNAGSYVKWIPAFAGMTNTESVKSENSTPYLKKQSQFLDGQQWLKYLYERELWRISCFEGDEKQSQTKPIYSFCVLRAAYCIIDLSFPWKRESSLLGSYGFRIKCGMTCLMSCFTEPYLKKQSQFGRYENCRKPYFYKGLRQ